MAREQIEKTLIILDEDEIRQIMLVACCNDPGKVFDFVKQVIAKKVEAALRQRCR